MFVILPHLLRFSVASKIFSCLDLVLRVAEEFQSRRNRMPDWHLGQAATTCESKPLVVEFEAWRSLEMLWWLLVSHFANATISLENLMSFLKPDFRPS